MFRIESGSAELIEQLGSATVGPESWRGFEAFLRQGSRLELIGVQLEGLDAPLYLRRGTTDVLNFRQIFLQRQYAGLPSCDGAILDLGGYIGLASAFFSLEHSEAQIVLVEPDPDNFLLACLNCRALPNVRCLQAGVWSHSGELAIQDKLRGDWSITLRPLRGEDPASARIPGFCVDDLLIHLGLEQVDLLKMDIEGAEKAVFEAPTAADWIPRCCTIACELHDRLVPGCRFAVYRALEPWGFQRRQQGEGEIYSRITSASDGQV